MLSNFELRSRIAQLNRLNSRTAGYSTIAETYRTMTYGVTSSVNKNGAELYFRVRADLDERPTMLSQLGPPPADKVFGFQRCNPPGVPMFYTASRRMTALLESRVSSGKTVYLSQWIGKQALIVNTSLQEFALGVDSERWDQRNTIFYTHLDTLFTKRVHKDFSDDYKFTAAIAQQFTKGFHKSWEDIPEDGKIGFQYSSVVDIENSYNTVFHASSFDQFDILHFAELKITGVTENSLTAELTGNAVHFPDGSIVWNDDPGLVPAMRPKDRSVGVRWLGDRWQIDVHGRPMTDDEFSAWLNE